jgi:hypothetical protein
MVKKVFDDPDAKLFKHPGKKWADFGEGGNVVFKIHLTPIIPALNFVICRVLFSLDVRRWLWDNWVLDRPA